MVALRDTNTDIAAALFANGQRFFRDSEGRIHPIREGGSGGSPGPGPAEEESRGPYKVGEQTPHGPRLTSFDSDAVVKARKENTGLAVTSNINTPERKALRTQITNDLYGKGAAKKNKEVWVLSGPPGAGKSSYANSDFLKKTGAMLVDADEAKKKIPEFNGSNASQVHKESTDISNDLMGKALQNGDNFVYPTTGRDAGYLQKLSDRFKSYGYTAHLRLIDLPTNKAVERAVNRFNDPKDGRFVDPSFVQEVDGKPKEAYDFVKSNFPESYHDYEAYSSDVPRGESPRRLDGPTLSIRTRKGASQQRSLGMARHLRHSERNRLNGKRPFQTAFSAAVAKFVGGFFTDAHGKVHPIGGRDPHGRLNPAGPITPVAEQSERPLLQSLKHDGGFTFQTHQGAHATAGFALSPYPQREKIFRGKVTRADMHTYMAKNDDLLSRDDHFVGGWHDAENNLTYLDVSVVKDKQADAEEASRKYKQEAYFDLGKKQEVRVGARDDQTKNSRFSPQKRGRRGNRFGVVSALRQCIEERDGRYPFGASYARILMAGGFFTDKNGIVHPMMHTTGSHNFPDSLKNFHEVQSLGGSTGAKLVKDDQGNKYVLKRGANVGHIENEMDANRMYRAFGVPVPDFKRYEDKDGPVQVSAFVDGVTLGNMPDQDKANKVLSKYFAAHALLANWDAHGMDKDNVMFEHGDVTKPIFVDNGGALEYRAQGAKKPKYDGNAVEFDTLRDLSTSKTAKVFSPLTGGEIRSQIRQLKSHAAEAAETTPPHLLDTVSARLSDMEARANKVKFSGSLRASGPISGYFTDGQGKVHPLNSVAVQTESGSGPHRPPNLPNNVMGMHISEISPGMGVSAQQVRDELSQHQMPVWSDSTAEPVYNAQDLIGTVLHIRGLGDVQPKSTAETAPWTKQLTKDEVTSVRGWKDDSSRIKSAARFATENPNIADHHPENGRLNAFESALDKAPTHDAPLYRGIGDLSDEAYSSIVGAKTLTAKSPVSFGEQRQLIKGTFLGRTNVPGNSVFFTTTKHNARRIDDVPTDFSGEGESVVPRGSTYRIASVKESPRPAGGKHADVLIEYTPNNESRSKVELAALFAEAQRFFTDAHGKVHPLGNESGDGGGHHGDVESQRSPSSLLEPSRTSKMKAKLDAKAEAYFNSLGYGHDVLVKNSLDTFDRTTPQNKEDGDKWYDEAHGSADKLGKTHNISFRNAAGLIAVTSPRTEWKKNLSDADAIARVFRDTNGVLDVPSIKDQMASAAIVNSKRKPFDTESYHGKDKSKWGQSFVGPHKVTELPDDVVAATHPEFRAILPDSVMKGFRLMRGEDPDTVLGGPKVRSFFNAILQPLNVKTGTVDTHVARFMTNQPDLTSDQAHKIFLSTPERYDYMKRAMFDAAEIRRYNGNQFQAVSWLQWKSEHPQDNGRDVNATAKLAHQPAQTSRQRRR